MEADISILQKTGHFYFALTEERNGPLDLFNLAVVRERSRRSASEVFPALFFLLFPDGGFFSATHGR